jgi:aminoglycoside 2''-phosphotransferase
VLERGLNDPEQFNYRPALRHGDFGPNNILYDEAAQSISGIIDFDSLAVGDPALDAGAILSLGEDFFQRMCQTYPHLAILRGRAEFYRSTYALQEALHGLRHGLPAAFEAGIAEYR